MFGALVGAMRVVPQDSGAIVGESVDLLAHRRTPSYSLHEFFYELSNAEEMAWRSSRSRGG